MAVDKCEGIFGYFLTFRNNDKWKLRKIVFGKNFLKGYFSKETFLVRRRKIFNKSLTLLRDLTKIGFDKKKEKLV